MAIPRARLIDSSIYIFRAWFSMPDHWHSPEGWPLSAVYGYCRFLLEFIDATKPEHCAAAFDESLGSCYRNDLLPSYKSSRELPDEALAFQLNACKELTRRLGVPCYGGSRYEADDYLATLARLYRQQGIAVSIVTRDKDLGQLLQADGDEWLDYGAGVALDAQGFEQKFGVRPTQFADYLALVGDPVDDIPGVPGVGAKTAAQLLQACNNLEQLGGQLDQLKDLGIRGAARIQNNLQAHWPQVQLARQLTVLEEHVPGLDAVPAYQLSREGLSSLADYLAELNLSGPLTRRCLAMQKGLPS
ncbi:MAG: 5'-3' exonuclease H3TH domain-containing protein [Halioglobus sp.]